MFWDNDCGCRNKIIIKNECCCNNNDRCGNRRCGCERNRGCNICDIFRRCCGHRRRCGCERNCNECGRGSNWDW